MRVKRCPTFGVGGSAVWVWRWKKNYKDKILSDILVGASESHIILDKRNLLHITADRSGCWRSRGVTGTVVVVSFTGDNVPWLLTVLV